MAGKGLSSAGCSCNEGRGSKLCSPKTGHLRAPRHGAQWPEPPPGDAPLSHLSFVSLVFFIKCTKFVGAGSGAGQVSPMVPCAAPLARTNEHRLSKQILM